MQVGETATFSRPSWFGEEGQEVIVISNDDYLLLEYESKKIVNLGENLLEAKEKLRNMGKEKNFPDFMND